MRYTLLLILFSVNLESQYFNKIIQPPIPSTYNSIGQTGLIHLPNATVNDEGTLGLTFGSSSLNNFISLVATPFTWMEASFFYHRPKDTIYGLNSLGKYLDKGFNVKFSKRFGLFDFGIGIDDIGGTGLLSKEYIAITMNNRNYRITFGAGTGLLSAQHNYTNPISAFKKRPKPNIQLYSDNPPGNVNFNSLFKGPTGIFAGLEIYSRIYPGLVFKIESNPYDYMNFLAGGKISNKFLSNRRKTKNFNYGFHYALKNNFSISLSNVKGNSYDLTISKKFQFNNNRPKIETSSVEPRSQSNEIKLSFYQNILRNLENDSIYLQSANLDDTELELAVTNNRYNNPIDLFNHNKIVIKEIEKFSDVSIKKLSVITVNSGMETGKMTGTIYNPLNNKVINKNYLPPTNDSDSFEFQTILSFPEFYFNLSPNFIYRYADPTRFFAGGLDIMLNSELKFSPSFYIVANYSLQVLNSFQRLRYYPDSPFLPHVRTDVVKYLNERRNFYLNNLQLDKLFKLKNSHYLKLSTGYYEMMFGGNGIEYYWKPFDKNFSFGLNVYNVRQRNFKQQYKFNNYRTETGHANLMYFHDKSNIFIDLSIGKYLAGDKGYTLDLSRKFSSGFEMGAYFTRTNISKKVYGEGSFDKGIYFKLPLSLLNGSSRKGKSNVLIQPLTRDGGAKLKTSNPLIYSIISGAKYEYLFYDV